jgi:hypothetical protein
MINFVTDTNKNHRTFKWTIEIELYHSQSIFAPQVKERRFF